MIPILASFSTQPPVPSLLERSPLGQIARYLNRANSARPYRRSASLYPEA